MLSLQEKTDLPYVSFLGLTFGGRLRKGCLYTDVPGVNRIAKRNA